ncbi:VpsF family polysaccharide biosynthesis protein [Chthonobacter rhizosphaerae]|uniref:VpsF family polysaccharide biosynthesis protein n=1 Tax=Chthonobacter rhizosphaerae TaxID=2735553 RepID=UPI0015EEC927|nr:VpsF family polysaccharide biosynthesis protein [Chthonobacter rhizosphaerae]
MQLLLLASVVLLFGGSANALTLFGIGYFSPTSGLLEKIHPTFYLAVVAAGAALLNRSPADITPGPMPLAAGRQLAVVAGALGLSLVAGFEAGGGELSILVVTFALPAVLAIALRSAAPDTTEAMDRFLQLFFAANSLLALFEAATGQRLLPFVAGTHLIDFDNRPTALLGHPLNNGLMTGVFILAIMMRDRRARPSVLPVLMLVLHAAAMLSFGARAAVGGLLALLALRLLVATGTALVKGQGRRDFLRFGAFAIALLVASPVLLHLGVADVLIERISDAGGSNETRYAAFQMIASVSLSELMLGTSFFVREDMMLFFDSPYGIELSWIGLALTFGVPAAFALIVSTHALLLSAGRSSATSSAFIVLYFALVTFTSVSISSKSLLTSQCLVVLAVLMEKQAAPVARRPAQRGDALPRRWPRPSSRLPV